MTSRKLSLKYKCSRWRRGLNWMKFIHPRLLVFLFPIPFQDDSILCFKVTDAIFDHRLYQVEERLLLRNVAVQLFVRGKTVLMDQLVIVLRENVRIFWTEARGQDMLHNVYRSHRTGSVPYHSLLRKEGTDSWLWPWSRRSFIQRTATYTIRNNHRPDLLQIGNILAHNNLPDLFRQGVEDAVEEQVYSLSMSIPGHILSWDSWYFITSRLTIDPQLGPNQDILPLSKDTPMMILMMICVVFMI